MVKAINADIIVIAIIVNSFVKWVYLQQRPKIKLKIMANR
jgi:hypothetical protein